MQRVWSWICTQAARLHLPLFLASLAAAGGIYAAKSAVFITFWIWVVLAMGSLALLWRSHSVRWLCAASALTFGTLFRAHDENPIRDYLVKRSPVGVSADLEGIVRDAPTQDPYSPGRWRFPLEVTHLNGHAMPRLFFLIKARLPKPPKYGDAVCLQGTVRMDSEVRNPGEFAYAEYLRREGFTAEAAVLYASDFQVKSSGHGWQIFQWALNSREAIGEAVVRGIENDAKVAATVRTMVLGTQEATPAEVEQAYINSGTMHVFAVSGLHVALFGWVLWQICKPLRLRRSHTLLLVIPLMFFYVFITGCRASAWRAALMASVFFLGPALQRQGDVFTGLGFAALCLFAYEPQQLFQPGFQLSFGVLLSLALLTKFFMEPLAVCYSPDPYLPLMLHSRAQLTWLWWKRKIFESISVSLASTLGSAPLMIAHFGLWTPIGILANLFLVALSSAILYAACVSLVFSGLQWTWMAVLANNANWALASLSTWLAGLFASIPGGHIPVRWDGWEESAPVRATVLAMPEGGSALRLRCGEQTWLIDCGNQTTWARTVRPHLLYSRVQKLDGLILTHRDSNHSAASGKAQEDFAPTQVFIGPLAKPDPLMPHELQGGQVLQLSPEVVLRTLYPPRQIRASLADDRCPLLMLEYSPNRNQTWRILISSDAGFLAEQWLLEQNWPISCHLVIKGKNALDHSGTPDFLTATRARAVIYSNATYPSEEQVSRLWHQDLVLRGMVPLDLSQTGGIDLALYPEEMLLRAFRTRQHWRFTP